MPALPRDDAYWSHSDYCPNFDYVKKFVQDLNAGRVVSTMLTALFFLPIGAGIADKVGRKPVFFFGMMVGIKSLVCNLLASLVYFVHLDPRQAQAPDHPQRYHRPWRHPFPCAPLVLPLGTVYARAL